MALSKEVVTTVEVLEDGTLQLRDATYIVEDGVRIAGPNYFRVAVPPGDAVALNAKTRDPLVGQIADLVWTPARVAAYQTKLAAQALPIGKPVFIPPGKP
jgi:hypothetical protein